MTAITEVKIYKSPKKVYKALAKEFYKITFSSKQARFNLALSGGNSPLGLFDRIVEKFTDKINWERIHLWWGDERCVDPDNNASNYFHAKEHLISKVSIPEENIHRIRGEEDPEKEAERYSNEIMQNLNYRGENPVFDIIILGIGEDGHTASIFPDQLELFEDEKNCAASQHPLSGQNRITLTGRVLNNANIVCFVVTGEKKAQRIAEIMNDDEAAKLLPAYYISPKNGKLIWFIDEAAGAKIM
jgi:6-phosphogluconolactonase